MAFLDHIQRCNAHDLNGYRPFFVANQQVGWVRLALADRLLTFPQHFEAYGMSGVALASNLEDFKARSTAMAETLPILVREGFIRKLRKEKYPVLPRWGAPPLMELDRGAVPAFGVDAYGLHVNGFVRHPDGGLSMWIGRRSNDRNVAPGKFDNLVAGGQPIGLSLRENLVKEAEEEAGLGRTLALQARPAGAITYRMENDDGLKSDTLFVFDLELTPDVLPVNQDGEVSEFRLLPIAEVAAIVRDTDDFKFNCNLVVLDFLVRHGFLDPELPEYLDIVRGLRR